ncbi:MAG: hypothetical protein J0H59_00365 [Comamonadaceae bacterium]|nr:hypothetical protein [Comamonadaceae bacterium]
MVKYTPPSTDDLQRLKDRLGFTGEQMAALASVAGGQQWRKYTGGVEPRSLNMHMAFFIAARLALDPHELQRVADKMTEIGAAIDTAALTTPPA